MDLCPIMFSCNGKAYTFAFIISSIPAFYGYYVKGGALEIGARQYQGGGSELYYDIILRIICCQHCCCEKAARCEV